MTIATDNVGKRRQMYIISCTNVPKQSKLVQKNEKLCLWCAQLSDLIRRSAKCIIDRELRWTFFWAFHNATAFPMRTNEWLTNIHY